MEKEQVQQAIYAAFPVEPIPTPRTIRGARAASDRSGAKMLRQELAGKSWQDLDPEFVTTKWGALYNASPNAYAYYLPAFLTAALNDTTNANDLLHSMAYDLRPDFWMLYYKDADTNFQARQAAFSTPQYHAVCAFLGLMFDQIPDLRHLAAQALHWGWNQMPTPALEAANVYYHELRNFVYVEPADPEIASLCQEIHAAFAATPYPGDNLSG